MRFFEGDIPMMICNGDTVSGTQKRESQSESFASNPFTYSFAPVPVSEEGGFFLDTPALQFSVNKDGQNLDVANEFMRFLITSQELNEMARVKRLVTPTTDLSFDSMYAQFEEVPESRIVAPEAAGITDDVTKQFREASYRVANGQMSVDEAVAQYGTLL